MIRTIFCILGFFVLLLILVIIFTPGTPVKNVEEGSIIKKDYVRTDETAVLDSENMAIQNANETEQINISNQSGKEYQPTENDMHLCVSPYLQIEGNEINTFCEDEKSETAKISDKWQHKTCIYSEERSVKNYITCDITYKATNNQFWKGDCSVECATKKEKVEKKYKIKEEQDISYLGCKRVKVYIVVEKDATKSMVDEMMDEVINIYLEKGGWVDVTVFAYKDESMIGQTAADSYAEFSLCN